MKEKNLKCHQLFLLERRWLGFPVECQANEHKQALRTDPIRGATVSALVRAKLQRMGINVPHSVYLNIYQHA